MEITYGGLILLHHDDDLRQLFGRWRCEESAAAPSFERTVAAARKQLTRGHQIHRWRALAAMGALAASVALWLAWGPAPRREGPPIAPNPTALVGPVGGYQPPTDLRLHFPQGTPSSTGWWGAEDSPFVSMLDPALESDLVGVPEPLTDEMYVQVALEGE